MLRLLTSLLLLSACGLRGDRVPPINGELADVIVQASFAGDSEANAHQGLLLDSLAFSRLGLLTGEDPRPDRAHTMVDPMDVLVCPDREPCRVRDDRIFLTVWDARRHDDGSLDLIVSRTRNIRGLYVMTESVAHELRIRPEAGVWRLARHVRLPG